MLNKIQKKSLAVTNAEAVKANPLGNAEEFLVIFYHVVAPAYMTKGAGAGRVKNCNKCQKSIGGNYREFS